MPAGFKCHQRMLTLRDLTRPLKSNKNHECMNAHTQLAATRFCPDTSWVMQTLSRLNKPAVGLRGNEATAKSVEGLAISWVTDEFIREVNSRRSLGKSCSISPTLTHTLRHQTPLWRTASATVSHLCSLVDEQHEAKATRDVWLQWYHHYETARAELSDRRHTPLPFCSGLLPPEMAIITLLHKIMAEQRNGWREVEAGETRKVWMVYMQPGHGPVLHQALNTLRGEETCSTLGNQQPLTH